MKNRSFLSRNYHKHKDMQRKDDLESWVRSRPSYSLMSVVQIYLTLNVFGRGLVPWNEQFADPQMLVCKERLFCDGCECREEWSGH